MKGWLVSICSLTLVLGTVAARAGEDDPRYALLTARIEQGIAQLTASIEGLDTRMSALERPQEGAGAAFNELQALDLSAWRLRRQQWALQRDHLKLARELLQQAAVRSGEKMGLAQQWAAHEVDYQAKLDAMRQERYELERKRLQVEGRLIETFLR